MQRKQRLQKAEGAEGESFPCQLVEAQKRLNLTAHRKSVRLKFCSVARTNSTVNSAFVWLTPFACVNNPPHFQLNTHLQPFDPIAGWMDQSTLQFVGVTPMTPLTQLLSVNSNENLL